YLNGGSLTFNNSSAFGSGPITFGGGTLRYASDATDYSGFFTTTSNQPFSIAVTSTPVSFASPLLSAGGSLAKLGSGTLTLNAVNLYSGPTNVVAGTLTVGVVNG